MTQPPAILRALPRRALSRLLGQVGRLPAPSWVLAPILRIYARIYGANLSEAERPVRSYTSFLDFFTRSLKPGARVLDADPLAIVSPADGTVQRAGAIVQGTLLQVKGVTYPVADLLGDAQAARRFEDGSFLVVYLAPGDYHRFHWPMDASLERMVHLPGDLWPVNARAVSTVPGLFARNERVALHGRTPSGQALAFIPVGALNVGSIRLAFSRLRTNRRGPGHAREWDLPPIRGRRGDELGYFEFGSSIVLLLARGAGTLDALEPGTRLRMGQRVGRQFSETSTRTGAASDTSTSA